MFSKWFAKSAHNTVVTEYMEGYVEKARKSLGRCWKSNILRPVPAQLATLLQYVASTVDRAVSRPRGRSLARPEKPARYFALVGAKNHGIMSSLPCCLISPTILSPHTPLHLQVSSKQYKKPTGIAMTRAMVITLGAFQMLGGSAAFT